MISAQRASLLLQRHFCKQLFPFPRTLIFSSKNGSPPGVDNLKQRRLARWLDSSCPCLAWTITTTRRWLHGTLPGRHSPWSTVHRLLNSLPLGLYIVREQLALSFWNGCHPFVSMPLDLNLKSPTVALRLSGGGQNAMLLPRLAKLDRAGDEQRLDARGAMRRVGTARRNCGRRVRARSLRVAPPSARLVDVVLTARRYTLAITLARAFSS